MKIPTPSSRTPRKTALLHLLAGGWLALLALAVGGCGSGASATRDAKVFESAPPAIKTAWDGAIAAAATNDYATAILTLQGLRAQGGLTPEQIALLDQTDTSVRARMTAAAEKGDPQALEAVKQLRSSWRR